jgi:hypothetical protein
MTPVEPQDPKDDATRKLSASQIYAIGAVALLAVVVIVNQPRLTIIASAVGLVTGAFVLRRGNVQRVAMVAMAGFAAALVIGVFGLLQ